MGGWFVAAGALPDVVGAQVRSQQLYVCRLFVFLKRVDIHISLTERVQRVSVKCINSQLCFFVKQTRKQT